MPINLAGIVSGIVNVYAGGFPYGVYVDREPTPDERLQSAALQAARETLYFSGLDFGAHISRTDVSMVEKAVGAAWEVWKKGVEGLEEVA